MFGACSSYNWLCEHVFKSLYRITVAETSAKGIVIFEV
jgi:hypothetical protein